MLAATGTRRTRRGAVMVVALLVIVVLSALVVALANASGTNVQTAANQHKINGALHAAQSGLECARYLAATVPLDETYMNHVTVAQANKAWTDLGAYVRSQAPDGKSVPAASRFSDDFGPGDQIVTQSLDLDGPHVQFTLRFYRYDADPRLIKILSFGTYGEVVRRVGMDLHVMKDREVLKYALASRGRIWLTGDTTIHGDLFSAWDRADISPYNMTSDSAVRGTINTVLDLADIRREGYRLETLNADNQPLAVDGTPLSDNYEDRYYGSDDEIKAYHEGITYRRPFHDMPGMDISDFNTDLYTPDLAAIPAAPSAERVTEYFPHAQGNYSQPRDSGSTSFSRHVYENQTFTNTLLPMNRHALFRNCTFEQVLYVDCSKTSTSKQHTNNVRFENCTFNGVIVTDAPGPFNWKNNCLYFTGAATFNNRSAVQEATILAPHFNVNLGNTNPQQSDNNVLTGAVIGGIVDVRGNAQVFGTIISMADTTMYSSGYVTNIGATLNDGGSETTGIGDVGVIEVTPDEDLMLPAGISSPIILKPDLKTYSEGV